MPSFVLRKSFGPHSAGTPVFRDTGTTLGELELTTYELPNGIFVPEDLVVERRPRSMTVKVSDREQRHKDKLEQRKLRREAVNEV